MLDDYRYEKQWKIYYMLLYDNARANNKKIGQNTPTKPHDKYQIYSYHLGKRNQLKLISYRQSEGILVPSFFRDKKVHMQS